LLIKISRQRVGILRVRMKRELKDEVGRTLDLKNTISVIKIAILWD
jgi:hypothetical protein